MAWLMSAIRILFYCLNGKTWRYTCHYAIGMNILWIMYACVIEQYGLIPSCVVLIILSIRNISAGGATMKSTVNCFTCRYGDWAAVNPPCKICIGYSKWAPKVFNHDKTEKKPYDPTAGRT